MKNIVVNVIIGKEINMTIKAVKHEKNRRSKKKAGELVKSSGTSVPCPIRI